MAESFMHVLYVEGNIKIFAIADFLELVFMAEKYSEINLSHKMACFWTKKLMQLWHHVLRRLIVCFLYIDWEVWLMWYGNSQYKKLQFFVALEL